MEVEGRFKQLWRIAYPIILFYIITYAVQFVVMICDAVIYMSMLIYQNKEVSEELATKHLYSNLQIYSIFSGVACIIVFLFILWLEKRKMVKNGCYVVWDKLNLKVCILVVLAGITASFGINGLIELSGITKLFPLYEEEYVELLYNENVWITVITSVILAPVLEELVFRRLVFKRMRENISFIPAALLSSIIFGVVHGNMVQGVFAFSVGYAICYLYEKCNNLWIPILFHAVINGTSVVVAYSPVFEKIVMPNLHYLIFSLACVLVMLVMCKLVEQVVEGGLQSEENA